MQEAPFSIQVELVEGCNLMCEFCGIHGIRKKAGGYKFMGTWEAKRIAQRIAHTGWKSRVEFAMHGEPTLNPNFLSIIKTFRKYLPANQLTVLTNGAGIVKGPKRKIKTLFKAGLNIMAIDDYSTNPFAKKIKEKVSGLSYPGEVSPHSRVKLTDRLVIYIQDITTAKSGGHSTINSHCGCATPPPIAPLKKRCAKPFRELSIRWDGHVAICCNDWRGHYVCGNVINDGIVDIWNNRLFEAARKLLYYKDRDFIPCKWCDAISYRIGFLPDKMGKEAMAEPENLDRQLIAETERNRPLTKVVKRPWEKKPRKKIKDYLG